MVAGLLNGFESKLKPPPQNEIETMDDIKKIDIYELLGIVPAATEQEVSFLLT